MKAINHACFKLEEKTLELLKRREKKNINIIGNKFTMSIISGKLTISFCDKLFSCINYLQSLK